MASKPTTGRAASKPTTKATKASTRSTPKAMEPKQPTKAPATRGKAPPGKPRKAT
jgi:hypothetical protein